MHVTYGITKISLILFYKRIFVKKWFRVTGNILMAIVGAWMVAACLVRQANSKTFEPATDRKDTSIFCMAG